jgi:hypothetical protein
MNDRNETIILPRDNYLCFSNVSIEFTNIVKIQDAHLDVKWNIDHELPQIKCYRRGGLKKYDDS